MQAIEVELPPPKIVHNVFLVRFEHVKALSYFITMVTNISHTYTITFLFLLLVTLWARTDSEINSSATDHVAYFMLKCENEFDWLAIYTSNIRTQTHKLHSTGSVISSTLEQVKLSFNRSSWDDTS